MNLFILYKDKELNFIILLNIYNYKNNLKKK